MGVLDSIDDYVVDHGLEAEVLAPERFPIARPDGALERLDLDAAGVSTVIWATGHRRPYPWLQIPVRDAHGELRQRRGVTPVPGLYVVGQRFQHWPALQPSSAVSVVTPPSSLATSRRRPPVTSSPPSPPADPPTTSRTEQERP